MLSGATNLFRQIVAAVILLLFVGVSSADCLATNAPMSSAEKACCQQMAGQCDTGMGAEHPCCKKTVPLLDAELNAAQHSASRLLPFQLAILEPSACLQVPAEWFIGAERPRSPRYDPPLSYTEVLRI